MGQNKNPAYTRKGIKNKRKSGCISLMSALLLCLLLGLSGCSGIGGKSSYPEVEKYLKSRYGGKFRIEEVTVDGAVFCYQVTQKDGEQLTFDVFPAGEEYTEAGFDDTCPVAFVQKKAEEMGLVLEPGTGEKELVATVDGYGELEELAGKLAEIADAYEKADLPAKFTKGTVGDGWNSANIRVEIRNFSPEGYRPGVIRIPDSITGFHDKESMEQYLEKNYLTYLDRYYLGEIPADVPEEAFQMVAEDENGITVISGDRTTEYPALEYNELYFAQVYRMACEEGWEPEAEGNSFTIPRGEESFRFELVFEERTDLGNREEYRYSGDWKPRGYAFEQEPTAYWYPAGGEEKGACGLGTCPGKGLHLGRNSGADYGDRDRIRTEASRCSGADSEDSGGGGRVSSAFGCKGAGRKRRDCGLADYAEPF